MKRVDLPEISPRPFEWFFVVKRRRVCRHDRNRQGAVMTVWCDLGPKDLRVKVPELYSAFVSRRLPRRQCDLSICLVKNRSVPQREPAN